MALSNWIHLDNSWSPIAMCTQLFCCDQSSRNHTQASFKTATTKPANHVALSLWDTFLSVQMDFAFFHGYINNRAWSRWVKISLSVPTWWCVTILMSRQTSVTERLDLLVLTLKDKEYINRLRWAFWVSLDWEREQPCGEHMYKRVFEEERSNLFSKTHRE